MELSEFLSSSLPLVKTDILQFSPALIGKQFLSSGVDDNKLNLSWDGVTGAFSSDNGMKWLASSIFVLIGFATYSILVRYFTYQQVNAMDRMDMRMAVEDVLKVGTMLIVFQILSIIFEVKNKEGKNREFNREWLGYSVSVLAGFVSYDLIVFNLINTNKIIDPSVCDMNRRAKMALDDTLKFGTMLIVSRLLQGKNFDTLYVAESVGFIGGLVFYNLVLSGL
jgi:hypothetical protein